MEITKIVELGKEIITLAAKYKYYSKKESENISNMFLKYKNIFSGQEDPYSNKIVLILNDILDDIKNLKPIQVDSIKEDDAVSAYFITKREYKIYSSIINKDSYEQIIRHGNTGKLFSTFIEDFNHHIDKLSPKLIAKYLLIFSLEEKIEPKAYLERLWFLSEKIGFTAEEHCILDNTIKKYNSFLKTIVYYGKIYLQNENFVSEYITVAKSIQNEQRKLVFNKQDASYAKGRSGCKTYEYKKALF